MLEPIVLIELLDIASVHNADAIILLSAVMYE